jgi:hypothetical protein
MPDQNLNVNVKYPATVQPGPPPGTPNMLGGRAPYAPTEEQNKRFAELLERIAASKAPPEKPEKPHKEEEGIAGKLGGFIGGTVAQALGFAGGMTLERVLDKAKEKIIEFVQAATQLEVVGARLDAVLAQNGTATEQYRKHLYGLAEEMTKISTVSREEWLQTLTRLNQFGADPKKMNEYAEGINNLAAKIGTTIPNATEIFIHAMEGNFTALSRYGIHVREAGTVTEKMDDLLKEVATSESAARSETDTLAGKWKLFKNSTEEAAAATGNLVVKTGLLQGLLAQGKRWMDAYSESVGAVPGKLDGLSKAQQTYIANLNSAIEAQRKWDQALADSKNRTGEYQTMLNSMFKQRAAEHEAEKQAFAEEQKIEEARIKMYEEAHAISPQEAQNRKDKLAQQKILKEEEFKAQEIREEQFKQQAAYNVQYQAYLEKKKQEKDLQQRIHDLGLKGHAEEGARKLAEGELFKLQKDLRENVEPALTIAAKDLGRTQTRVATELKALEEQTAQQLKELNYLHQTTINAIQAKIAQEQQAGRDIRKKYGPSPMGPGGEFTPATAGPGQKVPKVEELPILPPAPAIPIDTTARDRRKKELQDQMDKTTREANAAVEAAGGLEETSWWSLGVPWGRLVYVTSQHDTRMKAKDEEEMKKFEEEMAKPVPGEKGKKTTAAAIKEGAQAQHDAALLYEQNSKEMLAAVTRVNDRLNELEDRTRVRQYI